MRTLFERKDRKARAAVRDWFLSKADWPSSASRQARTYWICRAYLDALFAGGYHDSPMRRRDPTGQFFTCYGYRVDSEDWIRMDEFYTTTRNEM